jgi:hypothetical protein
MKRWLFNIAAGVSLVLWVGLVALLIASYHREIIVAENRAAPQTRSQSVVFSAQAGFAYIPRSSANFKEQIRDTHHDSWVVRWLDGFGLTTTGRRGLGSAQFLGAGITTRGGAVVPLWMPILTLAVLPGWWLIRWIHHRRKIVPGHCRVCGYDLRATPERCPECGTLASDL